MLRQRTNLDQGRRRAGLNISGLQQLKHGLGADSSSEGEDFDDIKKAVEAESSVDSD